MTSKCSGQCQLFISLSNNWVQYKCDSHKSYFVPESKKNLNLSQLFLTLDKRSTYISDEPTKSIFCLLKSGNYYKDLMYTISE